MAKIGEEMDFMERFIHDHKVPRDALDHFASVPWTRPYLEDPVYKTIPTFSRVLKETGEDFFFARTLATPQTIPLLVSLQLKDLKLPAEAPKGTKVFSRDHTQPTEVPEKTGHNIPTETRTPWPRWPPFRHSWRRRLRHSR